MSLEKAGMASSPDLKSEASIDTRTLDTMRNPQDTASVRSAKQKARNFSLDTTAQMEAFQEYKIFDKTFVGIYNTMKQKHNMLKTNTFSRTYSIARENKNSMKPSSSLSKKNVLSESSFLPPQTSPSMIDGFMTVMLLGETFEILHGIVALSPEHGQ